jgi:hypothetical protein
MAFLELVQLSARAISPFLPRQPQARHLNFQFSGLNLFSNKMLAASTRVQRPTFTANVAKQTKLQPRRVSVAVRAAAITADDVPTPEKRTIMNLLLLGAVGAPVRCCSHLPVMSTARFITELYHSAAHSIAGCWLGGSICALLRA